MLANMAVSLIKHKRIRTTTAKAKALRTYVEPLITKSKNDTTHSRRTVFAYLKDKYAVTELFRDVASKVGDRPGGYTRILKVGNRMGDNAEMCIVELVDYNENYTSQKEPAKQQTRRTRRGGAKKADAPAKASEEASENVASEPNAVAEDAPVDSPSGTTDDTTAEAPQEEQPIAQETSEDETLENEEGADDKDRTE